MTVLSTARSSPGLAKPELRQPLNPPRRPPSPIRAPWHTHSQHASVRVSRFDSRRTHFHRAFTRPDRRNAPTFYALPPRASKKNTPLLSFPRIFLIQIIFLFIQPISLDQREREEEKVTFRKRFQKRVSNSPTLKSDRVFRSILSRLVSSRFHSRTRGERFHAMRRESWKDTEFEKSLERSRREEERVEKNGRGP